MLAEEQLGRLFPMLWVKMDQLASSGLELTARQTYRRMFLYHAIKSRPSGEGRVSSRPAEDPRQGYTPIDA